jgi:hypothetical protein
MHIRGVAKMVVAVAVAATGMIAASCGSPEPTGPDPTPTLTPTETAYVGDLRSAWGRFFAKNAAFGTAFQQTWPLRTRLFTTLRDAGAGTAFVGTLEALEGLTPPERFTADHDIVIAAVRDLVRIDVEAREAIDREDLVGFFVANRRLGEVMSAASFRLSPLVCRAGEPPNFPLASLCSREAPAPGGEYGAQLDDALRRLEAVSRQVGGLVGFKNTLEPSEFLGLMAAEVSKSRDQLSAANAEIKSLQPPSEYQADHDTFVRYLEDRLQRAGELVEAAGAGDYDGVERIIRDPSSLCEARGALQSPEFRDLARVHLQGPPGICGGEPY